MSEKKNDQNKEMFNQIGKIVEKEVSEEMDEIREEIVDLKEDLIEEIRADETREEKRNYGLFIIICILAVVIIAVLYFNKNGNSEKANVMPKEEATNNALEFIKEYLAPGMELELMKIEEEPVSFYKFIVKSGEQEIPTYISSDGVTMLFNEVDITKSPYGEPESNMIDGKNAIAIEGGFQELEGAEVCKENGKPIVYFFGSKSCPHCVWQEPVITDVAKTFGSKIAFKSSVDSDDNMDTFLRFNPNGSIPAIIIGCKYVRIGSGEGSGVEGDTQTLTTLINNVLQ